MASEVNELSDAKDTCGMESKQGRVLKDKCDSNEKNSYIGILLGKFTTAFKLGYHCAALAEDVDVNVIISCVLILYLISIYALVLIKKHHP